MKTILRNTLLLCALGATLAAAGCSSGGTDSSGTTGTPSSTTSGTTSGTTTGTGSSTTG